MGAGEEYDASVGRCVEMLVFPCALATDEMTDGGRGGNVLTLVVGLRSALIECRDGATTTAAVAAVAAVADSTDALREC